MPKESFEHHLEVMAGLIRRSDQPPIKGKNLKALIDYTVAQSKLYDEFYALTGVDQEDYELSLQAYVEQDGSIRERVAQLMGRDAI